MNENNTLRTAVGVGGFLVRHLLALAVMVAVPCVLWTVAYLALLLCAIVVNEDPGALLTYPAGLVVIFTGALGFGLCVCFPITAAAQWISERRRWPMMVQFPVSLSLMALGLILVAFVAAIQPDAPWPVFPGMLGIGFVVLVGPFTIYWGLAQSVPMSWAAYRWIRKFFRERNLLNDG